LFFVEEDMAETAKQEEAKKAPRPGFLIENVVRREGTRLHRARSITRHRFKIYIAGQRLVRNTKLPLTAEQFAANGEQIVELLKEGAVAVHTPDNVRVTTLPDGRYVLTRMKDGAHKVLEADANPFEGIKMEAPKAPKKPEPKVEAPKEEAAPEPTVKTEPDDLTELPNIGGGRARKLTAAGITSFAQIASMGADALAETLGVDDGMAAEIVEAAKGR
jgi:predicted flap endonuclease-1-like 5' DNA nuclease